MNKELKPYTVFWECTFDAISKEDAARKARTMIIKGTSYFDVTKGIISYISYNAKKSKSIEV